MPAQAKSLGDRLPSGSTRFLGTTNNEMPFTPSGANVNIDLLLETNGQTALYRGAGFAALDKATSKKNFTLDLRSAQISLERHTPGFKPSFLAAELTGKIGVENNPLAADTLMEDFDRKYQNLRR